mmetsp:Transcript_38177/g.114136  ORF Transcript_38177/g.114136 Transcript_38177/m.114136 type:complete len:285 (-) Transcript_38177:1858-2712(-)
MFPPPMSKAEDGRPTLLIDRTAPRSSSPPLLPTMSHSIRLCFILPLQQTHVSLVPRHHLHRILERVGRQSAHNLLVGPDPFEKAIERLLHVRRSVPASQPTGQTMNAYADEDVVEHFLLRGYLSLDVLLAFEDGRGEGAQCGAGQREAGAAVAVGTFQSRLLHRLPVLLPSVRPAAHVLMLRGIPRSEEFQYGIRVDVRVVVHVEDPIEGSAVAGRHRRADTLFLRFLLPLGDDMLHVTNHLGRLPHQRIFVVDDPVHDDDAGHVLQSRLLREGSYILVRSARK